MSAKNLIVILLLIAGGVSAASLYSQTDSLKRELAYKQDLNRRLGEQVQTARQKMEADKNLLGQWSSLYQRNTELNGELASLKETRTQVVKQIFDACTRVREKGKEVEVPELTLPNGKSYQGVKLHKFGASEVTILHVGGTAKIRSSELPVTWVKRFRLDDPIMAPPPAPAVAAAGPAKPSPEQMKAQFQDSVKRQATHDMEGRIALIDTQIRNLEDARQQATLRANQYRSQHNWSRFYGKIDSYMAEAQNMELQVESYNQQIAALRTQQTNLQNSLRAAQAAAGQ